jgi:hypothetical protein
MGLGGATGRTTLFTCPIQEANLVLLSGPEDPVHVREDDHVAVLERPAERLELLDAVWQLLIDGRWAREEAGSHA